MLSRFFRPPPWAARRKTLRCAHSGAPGWQAASQPEGNAPTAAQPFVLLWNSGARLPQLPVARKKRTEGPWPPSPSLLPSRLAAGAAQLGRGRVCVRKMWAAGADLRGRATGIASRRPPWPPVSASIARALKRGRAQTTFALPSDAAQRFCFDPKCGDDQQHLPVLAIRDAPWAEEARSRGSVPSSELQKPESCRSGSMGACSPPPLPPGLATGKPLALLCPRGWLEREEGRAGRPDEWLRSGAPLNLHSSAAASNSRALGSSAAAGTAAAAVFLRHRRGLGRRGAADRFLLLAPLLPLPFQEEGLATL